jgi:transposase
LFYMVRTGCQWRQLPREFPPYTTVQHYEVDPIDGTTGAGLLIGSAAAPTS